MPLGHLLINNESLEKKIFTTSPEFSYFKSIYRKVSDFSIEDINQYFVNEYGFSKRSSCILHNNADLINTIYFVVTLPNIPYLIEYDLIGTSFCWVKNIGEKIIKFVEIEIDNNIIQKISGTHINIFNRLHEKNGKNIDKMIGNIYNLQKFSNKKNEYTLYVPIPFWFCENVGNSLPINRFDINKIKINIELEDINNLIIYGPTYYIKIKESDVNFKKYEYIYQSKTKAIGQFFYYDKNTNYLYYNLLSKNNFELMSNDMYDNFIYYDSNYFITNKEKTIYYIPIENQQTVTNNYFNIDYITLTNAYFQIRYIFLDTMEQKIIKESKDIQYIIKQYKYINYNNIESIKNNFNINGKNCVFDITWVTILENDILNKNFFEYSNNISNSSLNINSFDIYSLRNNEFINLLLKFYHYDCNQVYNINSYPFNEYSLDYQPSGTINLSKIEKCNLFLEFDKSISINNRINVYIIISSYNILKIKNNKIKLEF